VSSIQALVERAQSVRESAVAGTLGDVGPILRELEATTHPLARAWAAALRSELWLVEPRYGFRVTLAWLEDFVDGPALARSGAMVALSNAARAAMLDFDGESLAYLETVGRALAPGLSEAEILSAELVGAWATLSRADVERAREQANEIVGCAKKAELAACLVEAQTIRALAATAIADHEQALDLAKRASLVARTEGLPQLEFFAHLGLARARRYARQPHLSLRILDALAPLLTKPWRAWTAWESLLAGGSLADESLADAPESRARTLVLGLTECMRTAAHGDRPGFDAGASALSVESARFGLVHGEAREVCAALDPALEAPSVELSRWRHGETVLTPRSIHGLRLRGDEEAESAAAYVLTRAGQRGARLLHGGLGLLNMNELARVQQSQRAQGRVETLLSILALAGPDGVDETTCFREAYGFEFEPELHRGVFDVLVHRARATIEGHARLERVEGTISLLVDGALLIPDPRVSQRISDRVLRLLAERGRASAKDAAGVLGISLRSAQSALAELAESGACDARKDGRNVAYVVEDSVFSEPSRRLVATDLTGLTRLA
jgi:hypothetical protein